LNRLFQLLTKGCAITLFAAVALFYLLIFGLLGFQIYFQNLKAEYYEKPAVIAGYKKGSLYDAHLLLYPDSTYYSSNSNKGPLGTWVQISDTLFLKQKDTTQAILVNYKPIQIDNPTYYWLDEMQFTEFTPAKIVKFPKHH